MILGGNKEQIQEEDIMELLKAYSKRYGVKCVLNSFGEQRKTRENSIVFPNGCYLYKR